MSIIQYVQDRRNRIVVGAIGGVGLIVGAVAGITQYVQPAYRVESTDGERIWEVSTKGAIGVGTGANAFGSNGQVLTSGGGSGAMMSWTTVAGGAGTFGSGNVLTILDTEGDDRFVNTSGDTMTGALIVQSSISGTNLFVGGGLVEIKEGGGANFYMTQGDPGGISITNEPSAYRFTDSDSSGNTLSVLGGAFTYTGTLLFLGHETDGEETGAHPQWYFIRAVNDINANQGGPTTTFVVTGTGRVGAGTATPEEMLEVVGTASASTLSIAGGNVTIDNQGNTVFNESSIDDLSFRFEGTSDENVLYIDGTNDSVGIGTNSPENTLEVLGSISGATLHARGSSTNEGIEAFDRNGNFMWHVTGNNTHSMDMRAGNNQGSSNLFTVTNYADPISENLFVIHSSGGITVNEQGDSGATSDSRFESDNNTHMIFLDASADSVGINQANPTTSLDVNGTISGASLVISDLRSCNTIDTDASGALSCGTDEGGGGVSFAEIASWMVDDIGDTMTGTLNIDLTSGTVGLNVSQTMSGESLYVSGSGAKPILFADAGSHTVFIGTSHDTVNPGDAGTPLLLLASEDGTNSDLEIFVHAPGGTNRPAIKLGRSSGSTTSPGIVADGDWLGQLDFIGYDTDTYETAARIAAFVDGTPGNGDMNGELRFQVTADGNNGPSNAMVIRQNGDIGIATVDPETKLDVVGTISGSYLTITNDSTISGALLVVNNIESHSTITGAILHAAGGKVKAYRSGAAQSALEIIGDAAGNEQVFLRVAGTGTDGAHLELYDQTQTYGAFLAASNNGTTFQLQDEDAENVLLFTGQDGGSLVFYGNNGSDVMLEMDRVTSRVRVGGGAFNTPFEVTGTMSGSALYVADLFTPGALIYADGSDLEQTAAGSSGQVMALQGTTPTWTNNRDCFPYDIAPSSVDISAGSGMLFPVHFSGAIVSARMCTKSDTASGFKLQIQKDDDTKIFSTPLEVDERESCSETAATQGVIDSTNNRVNMDTERIRFAFPTVGQRAASGVTLILCYDEIW